MDSLGTALVELLAVVVAFDAAEDLVAVVDLARAVLSLARLVLDWP